jgi:hypothetical protein
MEFTVKQKEGRSKVMVKVGRTSLLAMVLLGGLLGFALSMLFAQSGGNNWFIPDDHKQLAEKVRVYDATYGRYQTLHFERTGRTKMLSMRPLWTLQDKEYQYSLWTFTYGDDVNAVMMIWGPDENGKYCIEIAKLAGNQIDVTWPDGSKDTNIQYIGWPH